MAHNESSYPAEFDITTESKVASDFILRVLKRTDGNVNRLRRLYIKRAKNGCAKAKAYLLILNQYEEVERQRITSIVNDMQNDHINRTAIQKKKYSTLYPPVNI